MHLLFALQKHYQQLLVELQNMKSPEGCTEPSVDLTSAQSTDMEVELETLSPEGSGMALSAPPVVPPHVMGVPVSSIPSTSAAALMGTLSEDIAMSIMPGAMNSVSVCWSVVVIGLMGQA